VQQEPASGLVTLSLKGMTNPDDLVVSDLEPWTFTLTD
jgi:hypothetical protein